MRQLTDYLYARREAILTTWRTRCSVDIDLLTRTSFSREEFNDQMPVLLDILAQRLLEQEVKTDPVELAGQHGLHRWQRGYSFQELLQELNHFYLTLTEEIYQYLQLYPDTPASVIALVNQHLVRLATEVNAGSIIYYDSLRQTSAAEQAQSLQLALDHLQQLTHRRSEHLREMTHDLRGNFGLVSGAASLLKMPLKEGERQQFLDMLSRNVGKAVSLLEQLTNYARLEADQDPLTIKAFDAAQLVRDLVKGAQGLANERHIVLRANGPDQLLVKSDPAKVQHMVQNLLINALNYSTNGWINVSWAAENDTRWLVSVQDTGSGLREGPVALLAEQLKPHPEPTRVHQSESLADYASERVPATQAGQGTTTTRQAHSEGIGLFVVKRLSQLLKAGMDIETTPGRGTLIRIRLLTDQTKSEQAGKADQGASG